MAENTEGDDPRETESLDEVIEQIEGKLANLDERRRDLEQKIELKRARVREINETIANLEDIEETIDEGADSEPKSDSGSNADETQD